MAEEELDLAALKKARSMLLILITTCRETLLALEATANVLDTDLTSELSKMIDRSEGELEVLTAQIDALG